MSQGQPFNEAPEQNVEGRQARLWEAILPVAALIFFLALNIKLYGGEPHIPLVLGTVVAAIVGIRLGYSWKLIEEGMVSGIVIALKAVLILLVIGILIGVWIASGVVPLMIFYGLKLLTPEIFLIAACIICSIVSLATGSSWTTAGTVGVALIGVGQGLGMHLGMVAEAIISGAYFGDKMSPLSDTTNLAPAVAGSELFDHIRHMTYTTVPGLIIALILYAVLGLTVSGNGESSSGGIALILDTIDAGFNLSPLLLLPPLLVFVMVIYRIPALPALLGGAALGGNPGHGFSGYEPGRRFLGGQRRLCRHHRSKRCRCPPQPRRHDRDDEHHRPHPLRHVVWRDYGKNRHAHGVGQCHFKNGKKRRFAGRLDGGHLRGHEHHRARPIPVHRGAGPDVSRCF